MAQTQDRESRRLFAVLAAFYALCFLGRWGWMRLQAGASLAAVKAEYGHDEFVELRLSTRDRELRRAWSLEPPVVAVTRDGRLVETVAGLRRLRLRAEGPGAWSGRWPCPWNAPAGEYRPELLSPRAGRGRVGARPFRIGRRAPAPLPPGLCVVTLETDLPWASLRVPAPDGTLKDWRGLLDWVEYVGADAFWVLGGRTPGERPGEPWLNANLPLIPEMAAQCRRRGIRFGVYAQCFLTMSGENRVPGYEYALDFLDGRPAQTRAISLRDAARARDVAELLRRWRDVPGVDDLGIDYIRNAQGGVELVDDFYAEMEGVISPPEGFFRWSRQERMAHLAREKALRRDKAFVDAWQWWRAHRASQVIRRIKAVVGDAKPLWAFVLAWDKGWHHGQDPVMFNDAGADAEALMLYEADEAQYEALLSDWRHYLRRRDAQVLVGDVVDWPLHQRSLEGPLALRRRLERAAEGLYADGPACGVFAHDLGRALWGRLGPWTSRQWLDEVRTAFRLFKRRSSGCARCD